jgi:hypothetical protein
MCMPWSSGFFFTIYEFSFFCQTTTYKLLAHISLCITEFIGLQCRNMSRLMEPSSGDTLTTRIPLNYASYIVLIIVLQ